MEFTSEQIKNAFNAFADTTYDYWHDGNCVETLTEESFNKALNFLLFPDKKEFQPTQQPKVGVGKIGNVKIRYVQRGLGNE